jgi:hypothetical protein
MIKRVKNNVKHQRKIGKIGKIFIFTILNHINHGKLFLFHSYECEGIQTKNPFDKILNLSFNLGALKVNTYCFRRNQFCKGLI